MGEGNIAVICHTVREGASLPGSGLCQGKARTGHPRTAAKVTVQGLVTERPKPSQGSQFKE